MGMHMVLETVEGEDVLGIKIDPWSIPANSDGDG